MIDTKNLLKNEQKLTPSTAATTLACTLTGLVTYGFSGHSVWLQWSVLAHLFTGIACSLLITPYLIIHFRRTVGFRRTSVLISGLLTILLFVGFAGSGWQLLLHGQQESQRWVYQTHIVTAFIFVAIVCLHLLLHIKLLPQRRKESNANRFPSLPANTIKQLIVFNCAVQLFIAIAALIYAVTLTPYSEQAAVANYEYPYGEHRFRPSQTETTNHAFIDKRQIANSQRCISCHKDVAAQWLSSVHQQAASDPSYVTNVSLLAKKKGISATRYCEGCHAPVALLSGELTQGGDHGGIAGSVGNMEGVSCMGCHGIDSLVHLKGVASFQFTPAQDYLFARSESSLLLRLHDLVIRVKPDQHKRDLGKPLFKDPKFCSACHTQFMDKDMNDWGWIKMQDEYSAWLESPYSKQHEEEFSDTTTTRCQECHMPLLESNDPSADQNGKIRSHHFPGANTFLPLLRGDKKQLAATKMFLQSNKLRISIDEPNRNDALQTLHALDETLRNFEEAPYYYYLGEEAKIHVVVSNRGVGHDFPGGTIDINEAWIEFLVMDAEGHAVFNSGLIDSDNKVDKNAYFYRSLAIDRNGKLVWKHDLFNMVGESFRRVIKAGESDIVNFNFTVPSWAKSPLTVTATLKYRKLNDRYARWALKDQYIKIPVIDMTWDSLSIPIKIRKEVE